MTKRGRPPRFTREDMEDMKRMYRESPMKITHIAKLFRTSTFTVSQALSGKLKTKD